MVFFFCGLPTVFFDNQPKGALTKEEPIVTRNWTADYRFIIQIGVTIPAATVGDGIANGTDEAQQGAYQVRTEADQQGWTGTTPFYLRQQYYDRTMGWDARWKIVTAAAEAVNALEVNTQDPDKNATGCGRSMFYPCLPAFWTFDVLGWNTP